MRKLLPSIGLLIIFFFLARAIIAQAPVPGISAPLPGVNCGDADSVTYNKCCYNNPESVNPRLDTMGLFSIFRVVIEPLNSIIFDQFQKLFGLQRQYAINPCVIGMPSTPGNLGDPGCICIRPTDTPLKAIEPLCNNISLKNPKEKQDCLDCLTGKNGSVGVWTAVGCVYTNIGDFIKNTLLGWGIGLAGGFALLCVMYAAIRLQFSRANPESIKKAQELLTSCIMGLMLIIFSVFLLRLIGVDILRIPGFR